MSISKWFCTDHPKEFLVEFSRQGCLGKKFGCLRCMRECATAFRSKRILKGLYRPRRVQATHTAD